MALTQNYTLKLSLAEANLVKRALETRLTALADQLKSLGPGDGPATRHEYGAVEALLRKL
jgi:hypothetical protein